MPISPLSAVNRTTKYWNVCVYVSHLWHHRGGTDNGPIKHTDMVLLDPQGNHIYGEIPTDCVAKFMNVIEEGKVYELGRFMVYEKKTHFRAVEAPWMIKFGRYTSIQERSNVQEEFPFCTFSLTPITDLTSPTDLSVRFTDVAGIITGVSAATQYHSANRTDPSTKRIVYLSDLSGHQVSIVLWGERAIAFEGDWVLETSKESPMIAIFVGTLVKNYDGRRGLSGSAACRWYINEDLPEINAIHARLKDKVPEIETILLPNQTAAKISAQVDLETKTVSELIDLDIWHYEHTKFFCTVTILKLSPSQRWWFFSCNSCHKSSGPYGAAYKCSGEKCTQVKASPRYRLCYIGGDGQDEVEFVFFDRVGKEILGKPLISILRAGHSNSTSLEDIVSSTRGDTSIPRELAAVVSTKYRFVVQVTSKSFESESAKPSYQVHRIDTDFGKQLHSSALRHKPMLEVASSSRSSLSQSPRMLGSSAEDPSLLSGGSTLDAPWASAGSGATNSADVIPVQTTPPSVNKLPNLRNKNVSSGSAVRKPLFQGEDHVDQTGKGLGMALVLPANGPALREPLPTTDPEVLPTASDIIKKLEVNSGKLEVLPTDKAADEAVAAAEDTENATSPHVEVHVPAATTTSGSTNDKSRKGGKAGGNGPAKKARN